MLKKNSGVNENYQKKIDELKTMINDNKKEKYMNLYIKQNDEKRDYLLNNLKEYNNELDILESQIKKHKIGLYTKNEFYNKNEDYLMNTGIFNSLHKLSKLLDQKEDEIINKQNLLEKQEKLLNLKIKTLSSSELEMFNNLMKMNFNPNIVTKDIKKIEYDYNKINQLFFEPIFELLNKRNNIINTNHYYNKPIIIPKKPRRNRSMNSIPERNKSAENISHNKNIRYINLIKKSESNSNKQQYINNSNNNYSNVLSQEMNNSSKKNKINYKHYNELNIY